MKTTKPVLSVERLRKTYISSDNRVDALMDVSFDLFEGEMLAVMGTSGSGKSTLLNILGAMDSPTAGKISLNGYYAKDMFKEPAATVYRRENIGFIFQAFNLLKDLSVEENIALPLILKGLNEDETNSRVARMLEMIGLENWRKHRPVQLSGGQQQRIAIGRALITEPPIVLADELTGNLDFNTSTDILSVLVRMKDELNQSIVLVTHDAHVATHADRVLFFHDGTIVDEYQCSHTEADMDIILQKFKRIMEKEI